MKSLKNDAVLSLLSVKWVYAVLIGFFLMLIVQPLSAQSRLSLELRGAANVATQDLGDAKLETGIGLEGTIAYRFMEHLSIYGGWSWNHFASAESFAGTNIDYEETGYSFGLRFIHPIGTSSLSYLIGGGGIYNHIEAENEDGDIIADTGHGLGWQLDAGIVIPLGESWRITPGIRYRALSTEFQIDAFKTPVDLNYFSGGLGISFLF